MKYRKDFVTNSSSSSYICDITGNVEAGRDIGLDDAGMYECSNGHTFMESFLVGELGVFTKEEILEFLTDKEKEYMMRFEKYQGSYKSYAEDVRKQINKIDELNDKDEIDEIIDEIVEEYELNSRYEVALQNCPICTMNYVTDEMKMKYILKKNGFTEDDLIKEIKDSYNNFDEMHKDLKSK